MSYILLFIIIIICFVNSKDNEIVSVPSNYNTKSMNDYLKNKQQISVDKNFTVFNNTKISNIRSVMDLPLVNPNSTCTFKII